MLVRSGRPRLLHPRPIVGLPEKDNCDDLPVWFLPRKGLSNAHISCWVFGMRKTPTPPLPLRGRPPDLIRGLPPRRLGRKGEGPDLASSIEDGCLFMRRPVPHQVCLSSQARQGKPSSPNRERRRRWPARRQAFHPARYVHSIAPENREGPCGEASFRLPRAAFAPKLVSHAIHRLRRPWT